MIIFKKLRWKNLLSTGNVFTEIDLTLKNTTLIVGENGAGKSTMLDALSFGLFGKPFRKVNKGQLINSINNKGMVVEVEFGIGNKEYKIERGAKPNIFNVYQDGTLINHDASTNDYQDMLDKHILKINHKTFSQIVVLGSASFVPFMQMTAAHRREVIEDLLDIQIFTVMNILLKDKISLNRTNITEADYAIHGIEEKIELEQQHLQEIKNNNEELINQKQQQIITIQGEVNEANIKIEQSQAEVARQSDNINDHDKVRTRREKVVALVSQLDNKYDKIRKENEFFLSNNDCPTCRQGIAHDHRSEIVDSGNTQLGEIEQAKQKISEELNRLDTRLTAIADVTRTVAGINQEVYNALSGVRIKEGFIKSIQNEINQLSTSTHTEINITRLADLKKQLKEQTVRRETLGKERVTLETASVLLKDTGIKTKIIRQYVPVINKLINKYLASMDFFVNFELNESFEETLKSRFRDEFSYASFSEGEKSRIDLALLFTWRAISKLRNSTSTNLLILDEVFDGSLDSQGNEELLKIIQTLTEGNNVFVISHKTDAYIDKFDRVLKFEKQKNFSRMIEL